MNKDFDKFWSLQKKDATQLSVNTYESDARKIWDTAVKTAISKRAPKPRELDSVGTGALHSEQQYCFEKGWKEGIAAFRKMLRDIDV